MTIGKSLCVAAVVALSLSASALAQAGGGRTAPPNPCVPHMGPTPGPAPSPGPAPGPAPAPAPGSRSNPGGLTPRGGTTPGGLGGSTPGGGGGTTGPAGGGGFSFGGVTPRYGKKRRFNSEQAYWLGAIKLPWEGRTLPRRLTQGAEGHVYEGEEMTLDEAVRRGGDGQWKLEQRPTIVLTYNPNDRHHMNLVHKVSTNQDFVSASNYLNLVRINLEMVQGAAEKKRLGTRPAFHIYRSNGELVTTLHKVRDATPILEALSDLFPLEYGKGINQALEEMGAALAREAWVDDQIVRAEDRLIDPRTGSVDQKVREELRDLKHHRKELEEHKVKLARLLPKPEKEAG